MNDTIRAFAIRAGFPSAGFNANGPVMYNHGQIEVLAYQIIQECAMLVDKLQYSGDQIKEHFKDRKYE
jgi:hypothetical protein